MRNSRHSLLPLSIGLLVVSLSACGASFSTETAADAIAGNEAGTPAAMPADNLAARPKPPEGPQYQLLGIKDPDFGIVAFAIKIPRGWASKQAFQRQWNGANPMIQSYVVYRSPDAKQQIEYLPASQFIYSDGPGPNDLRMQKQSMGIDPRMAENELAPMPALVFLKRMVLPQMAQNGANPMIQSYVVYRSPDAKQQIEYLPASQFIYSDGPGPNDLRMQKQSMGIDPRMAENELAPMPALVFLKRMVLPQMAQNGLTLRDMGNERETAPHPEPSPGSDKPHMASSASVDGVLPNGNRARVEVRIGWNEMRNNQDVYYSWWATPSIIQTGSGDLSATYAHAQTAQTSILYNPQWLKQNRDLVEKGNQATSDSIRSRHAASMENIAQWGRINKANADASMDRLKSDAAASAARQQQQSADFNARMATNDRNHELFTDVVINGEAKYANPTTGERIKVDSSYDHTYTDNAGNYYQSNTPLKSNDVNWQEMQKVPFDDY